MVILYVHLRRKIIEVGHVSLAIYIFFLSKRKIVLDVIYLGGKDFKSSI